MTTFDEFVERQIIPALGEYADDYDVTMFATEVSVWDDKLGYVMRPDLLHDEFWEIAEKYDLTSRVQCPHCGAVNNIGKAVVNSILNDEVVIEMCCYQCGTAFRRRYVYVD